MDEKKRRLMEPGKGKPRTEGMTREQIMEDLRKEVLQYEAAVDHLDGPEYGDAILSEEDLSLAYSPDKTDTE